MRKIDLLCTVPSGTSQVIKQSTNKFRHATLRWLLTLVGACWDLARGVVYPLCNGTFGTQAGKLREAGYRLKEQTKEIVIAAKSDVADGNLYRTYRSTCR